MTANKLKKWVEWCGLTYSIPEGCKNGFWINYPGLPLGNRIRFVYTDGRDVYLDSWQWNIPYFKISGREHLKYYLEQ